MSNAPRPSAATLQSGMRIDRYEVLEMLGAGGFGAVYRARHVHTHQVVAMKVLRTGARENAAAWEALLREAKAMASIGHPNILKVYDAGVSEQGTPFLVMEFVEGADLGKLLQSEGHALVPERAIAIMQQVLAALGAAHARGVVHRDVKPANIIVRPVRDERGAVREQAMLLDFGISKLRDSEYARTQPGLAMGTPGFMAPEQIENAASADSRSDVYAAGVTLYLLLAARLPFDGANPQELISNMLLGATVPLRRAAPHVPSSLATVVDHAISRDPANRWPDATSFAAALESSMTHSKRDAAIGNAATLAVDPNALGTGPTTVKSVEELGNARTVAVPSSRPPPMFGSAPTPVASIPPPPLVPTGLGMSFSSATPAPMAQPQPQTPAPAGVLPPAATTALLPRDAKPPARSRRKIAFVVGAVVVLAGALAGAYLLGTLETDEGGESSQAPAAQSGGSPVPTPVPQTYGVAPTAPMPMPAIAPAAPPAPSQPTPASDDDDDDDSAAMAQALAAINGQIQQQQQQQPQGARNYGTGLLSEGVIYSDSTFSLDAMGPTGIEVSELEPIAARAVIEMRRCPRTASTPLTIETSVTYMGMGNPHVMAFPATAPRDAEIDCLRHALQRALPSLAGRMAHVTIRIRHN